MATTYEYTCPFCGLPTLLTEDGMSGDSHKLEIDNEDGPRILNSVYRVCPNPKCRKFSLQATLYQAAKASGGLRAVLQLRTWRLVPPSSAKAFPNFIPKAIR